MADSSIVVTSFLSVKKMEVYDPVLPLISTAFELLQEVNIFPKLYLQNVYHLVWIGLHSTLLWGITNI